MKSSRSSSVAGNFGNFLEEMNRQDFTHRTFKGKVIPLTAHQLKVILSKLKEIEDNLSKISESLENSDHVVSQFLHLIQNVVNERALTNGQNFDEIDRIVLRAEGICKFVSTYSSIGHWGLEKATRLLNLAKQLENNFKPSHSVIDQELINYSKDQNHFNKISFFNVLQMRMDLYPDSPMSPQLKSCIEESIHKAIQTSVYQKSDHYVAIKNDLLLFIRLAANFDIQIPQEIMWLVIKAALDPDNDQLSGSSYPLEQLIMTKQLKNEFIPLQQITKILEGIRLLAPLRIAELMQKSNNHEFQNFLEFTFDRLIKLNADNCDFDALKPALKNYKELLSTITSIDSNIFPNIQPFFSDRTITIKLEGGSIKSTPYKYLVTCKLSPVLDALQREKIKENNDSYDLSKLLKLSEFNYLQNLAFSYYNLAEPLPDFLIPQNTAPSRVYEIGEMLMNEPIRNIAAGIVKNRLDKVTPEEVVEWVQNPRHPLPSEEQATAIIEKIAKYLDKQEVTDNNLQTIFNYYQFVFQLAEIAKVPPADFFKKASFLIPKLFKMVNEMYGEGLLEKKDYIAQLEMLDKSCSSYHEDKFNKHNDERDYYPHAKYLIAHTLDQYKKVNDLEKIWFSDKNNSLISIKFQARALVWYSLPVEVVKKENGCLLNEFIRLASSDLWGLDNIYDTYLAIYESSKKANNMTDFIRLGQDVQRKLIGYLIERVREGKISLQEFDEKIRALANTQASGLKEGDPDYGVLKDNRKLVSVDLTYDYRFTMEHLKILSQLPIDILIIPKGTLDSLRFDESKLKVLFPNTKIKTKFMPTTIM